MIVEGTIDNYQEYLDNHNSKWVFGNEILYRMCRENPFHNQKDEIVGKIWLIGRSYAAAIERRKNATVEINDFYYDVVAPKMIDIGKELDERLDILRNETGHIIDNISLVVDTHKFLMDTFYEMTMQENRSLASKYLHFHCPEMFFIYDSRAKNSINKLVKKPNKSLLNNINDYDVEYGEFTCRMVELQE
jgi:hypothetical protein